MPDSDSSSTWGICLLVFLVLIFVIVACCMMYRPASSEPSSVRKCKLTQDSAEQDPTDTVKLRQTQTDGLPDMDTNVRKHKIFQAHKHRPQATFENDRDYDNNHYRRGHNGHLKDALGCDSDIQNIRERKRRELEQIRSSQPTSLLVPTAPNLHF